MSNERGKLFCILGVCNYLIPLIFGCSSRYNHKFLVFSKLFTIPPIVNTNGYRFECVRLP